MNDLKILIVFPPGAYGTYLNYLLSKITDSTEFNGNVFEPTGSAHHFRSVRGYDINVDADALDTEKIHRYSHIFFRTHGFTPKNPNKNSNLAKLIEEFDYFIHINFYEDRLLTIHNNMLTKQDNTMHNFYDWLLVHELDLIKSRWTVPTELTNPRDVERWIVREFCSMYFIPIWVRQALTQEYFQFNHKRQLYIDVKDFLNNPITDTIDLIFSFCQIDYDYDRELVTSIHQTMLDKQQHLHSDADCEYIVQQTLANVLYDFKELNLTLFDEAWIQWKLREHGYELQCYGLNTFPTNTIDLRKIIELADT